MTIVEHLISVTERAPLPDIATKTGINFLVGRTRRQLAHESDENSANFAREMVEFPIALATKEANDQHYEIPAEFFELALGARRKYSCAYYEDDNTTLDEAEERALALTAEHAALANGQKILELGCGWGSMTLWVAENFPGAHITGVSNSNSQREYILSQAKARNLTNIDVITADMNDFASEGQFDRVISIEMFEHMSNWHDLIGKVTGWLKPDGRFFMHVFSHKSRPYRFDHADKSDWIAQHFFTGGIMPSHDLIRQFGDFVEVEKEWRWSGQHYQRTAADWLANYDRNDIEIDRILNDVYGADAKLWKRRWRLFFLATMGLFGHNGGNEWGISHYLLKPVRRA
ncbi:MAG: cyclopropane-fatty-acyl-phospholipid synthase family protein [Filomicrobium sp.]